MSVYSDVQTLIGEVNGETYYTSTHLCNAINEATLYIYGRMKHKLITASISFGPGSDIVTIPSTVYISQTLTYDNKVWFPTTYARLEQYDAYWKLATTGQPRWFVLHEWNKIRCWPSPDTMYTFTLNGIEYPNEIDGSTVTDIVDNTFVKNAIVYRACANLVEHDFPQMADYYYAQSEENLHKGLVEKRNNLSHNIRRLRPGTLFTNAQSGSIRLGKRINY